MKHHQILKLKSSFLLKSSKGTLPPFCEKGTLYMEQMGWWLCDKPTQQPSGAGLSSRKEHDGLWLGSASPHFTSESTATSLFLNVTMRNMQDSTLQVRRDSKELTLILTWEFSSESTFTNDLLCPSPVPDALWTQFYIDFELHAIKLVPLVYIMWSVWSIQLCEVSEVQGKIWSKNTQPN